MTNEEVFKKVEERRKKEEINNKWYDYRYPICSCNNFHTEKTYSMLNIGDFLMMVKGRSSGNADYKVIPYECQECGYVALRKGK